MSEQKKRGNLSLQWKAERCLVDSLYAVKQNQQLVANGLAIQVLQEIIKKKDLQNDKQRA